MYTQAEAQKAISMLNGFSLEDRELKVNLAKPREDRNSGFNKQQSRSYRR
jgi:RNA recognition motif-containing protein